MNSEYKVWKVYHNGKNKYRVDKNGETLGYVASKTGAELLIAADEIEERMYSAPLESRAKPTMLKGVAID